jgi:hypothetical protein
MHWLGMATSTSVIDLAAPAPRWWRRSIMRRSAALIADAGRPAHMGRHGRKRPGSQGARGRRHRELLIRQQFNERAKQCLLAYAGQQP